MIDSTKHHWDTIYQTKAENEVSWYQTYPSSSMKMIESYNLPLNANIIDIGGGDSRFAEALIDKGYTNIHVLDISESAIRRAKERLGEKSSVIQWIVSDVTDFEPSVKFDCWHDRAAFHFLTTEDQVNKYVTLVNKAVKQEGCLVIGTFSEKGPLKCSGLEIKQYSEASLAERFGGSFQLVECFYEDHHTPFQSVQNFVFCSFRKRSSK
ncbi:MAG TPA: class I SAM-dependent methyltransferase [Prolixibacteraceae bacterium]|nr:class I SAM-dependent methyltransferase [Prolixibacteraceae bacterium]